MAHSPVRSAAPALLGHAIDRPRARALRGGMAGALGALVLAPGVAVAQPTCVSDCSVIVRWRTAGEAHAARLAPPAVLQLLDARVEWVSELSPGLASVETPEGLAGVALEVLRATPGVAGAWPDRVGAPAAAPNDDAWATQFEDYPEFRACLEKAWDKTTTSQRLIAVLDSGMEYVLADLAPNTYVNPGEVLDGVDNDRNGIVDDVHGAEFVKAFDLDRTSPDEARGSLPRDVSGHGTHVASIIGAVGGNGVGMAGVLWQARLMPVKVFGQYLYLSDALKGIEYAYFQGARLMNCSWQFSYAPGEPKTVMDPLWQMISETPDALYVVAAGNVNPSGVDLDVTSGPGIDFYPQEFPKTNILVVGNLKGHGSPHPSSNYGATSVDVFAPGTAIMGMNSADGSILPDSGTSYAAPIVTALAAMVWDMHPEWTPGQVRAHLMQTGEATPELEGRCVGHGNGRCVLVSPSRALGLGPCP